MNQQLTVSLKMEIRDHSFRNEWNESYSNGDNNILYPQLEVIRFLNRFIRKRTDSENSFDTLLDTDTGKIHGLDFGCGIGTHCITFKDFQIEGYGVDISDVAIAIATQNGAKKGMPKDRFVALNADSSRLPFSDNFFDFTVAESCLDSMPYSVAKGYVKEIKRVTKTYIYASFIGWSDLFHSEEFIIEDPHEKGTLQSVFKKDKIIDLFGLEESHFKHFKLVTTSDELSLQPSRSRYFCVVKLP